MSRWIVGVDFGQRSDRTAIAAVEVVQPPPPNDLGAGGPVRWPKSFLDLRYLERLPVGLAYPEQCARIAALLDRTRELERAEVVVDATGVGVAVADQLREVLARGFYELTITAGGRVQEDGNRLSVPKRDLVSRLSVAMEQRRLRVAPGLASARPLLDELGNFNVTISGAGHDSYGARKGHDDLVLAVSYAVWLADGVGQGSAFIEFMRQESQRLGVKVNPW